MGAGRRILKGVGHDVSPFDGDRLVIVLGVRDGRVATIGADGIACESARAAALVLHKVFIGRDIDESLAIGVTDVIAAMDALPENERCVSAVLRAVRNALVDIQVTVLAETIVAARTLRETG